MKLDKRGKIALSERDIQRQVIELLRAHGWIVRPAPRNGTKAIRGAFSVPAGEPDLICVKSVRFQNHWEWRVLMIECKEQKGKMRHTQVAWQLNAALSGIPVHIVRSVEDVEGLI